MLESAVDVLERIPYITVCLAIRDEFLFFPPKSPDLLKKYFYFRWLAGAGAPVGEPSRRPDLSGRIPYTKCTDVRRDRRTCGRDTGRGPSGEIR